MQSSRNHAAAARNTERSVPDRPAEQTEQAAQVRRAQQGDRSAYDKLVRLYQDRAVGYAYSLIGDFHLAQDAAQDAFLLAHRDLPTLSEPAAFAAWLRRIVHKCADRHTRRKRLRWVALDAAREVACPPHPQTDPARALEQAEMKTEVLSALGALSETDRTVLTLFYLGEHTTPEIATFLDVPAATVKKRLERARARLKETLLTMIETSLRENAPSRNARFAELSALLGRITDTLQADKSVAAAYLAHFGRGDGFGPHDDAWSSLNVHVVLRDDVLDTLATGRRYFAARLGEPLLFVEGPQNAPAEGGYYLMAVYDNPAVGPFEVDWYWHAQSRTTIPADTLVLFDRAGLPRGDAPPAWGYTENRPDAWQRVESAKTDAERRAAEGENIVSLFFLMLLVAAKHVARNPQSQNVPFSGMLRNLLRDTRRFLDPGRLEEPEASDDAPFPSPTDKLNRLRELAREMETLLPQVAATGVAVPTAAAPSARRFLDVVEADGAKGNC